MDQFINRILIFTFITLGSVQYSTAQTTYCTLEHRGNYAQLYINNVIYGVVNQSSNFNNDGVNYSDFSANSSTVALGSNLQMTVGIFANQA